MTLDPKKNSLFQKYGIDNSNLLCSKDEKEQLESVKCDGLAIRYMSNPSSEVQIEAVKQYGNAIQHITNPGPEVQLEAVKQDGNAIQFISNPSPEVQIQAVKKNGYAIQWISNPSAEVQLEAVDKLLQRNITDINEYYPHKLGEKALKYLAKNLAIKEVIK